MAGDLGALSTFSIMLGGVLLTIIPDPATPTTGQVPGFTGGYEAQESTNQLVYRDVPRVIGDFRRGAGYVRRTGPADDGGYAWGENIIMWTGEGAVPAGQLHDYDLTTVQNANGQGTVPINNATIVDIIEFLGHLWLIFDDVVAGAAAATIRIPNADPAQTSTYEPHINSGSFGSGAATGFRVGYHSRSAEIFQTAAGAAALVVGTNNAGTPLLYTCTAPNTWTESPAAGGPGGLAATTLMEKLRTVYWTALSETSGASRLLAKVAPNKIMQCTAGNDPGLNASWTTPIPIGQPDENIQAIVAAPEHAYAIADSGIYDFTDQRVRHLSPYWKMTRAMTTQAAAVTRGLPAMLHDDHIVASRGFGSMDRYPITSDGYQQRITGEAGIAFMQDGTPIRGWFTAYCDSGDGAILAALYNPDNGTSYVGRAYDRQKVGVPGPGPLVWHWAEVAYPKVSGVAYMITAMRVTAPALAAGSTLAAPKLYLWLGMTPSTGGQARLKYVEMPFGGGPLSIRASGGTAIAHASPTATVAQNVRLYLTGQQWDDMAALKAMRRIDLSHQGVTSTNKITVNTSADGDPATLPTRTWTTEGTADATSPNTDTITNIVPATVTTGHMLYTKLEWATATPFTAPARLQETRLRAAVRYEVFDVRYLYIIFSRDYELNGRTPDLADPDASFATVVAYQLTGPITYIDESSTSYQVLVEQGIRYDRTYVSEKAGYRTVARVQLSLVKAN